jgi:hypothetical protein
MNDLLKKTQASHQYHSPDAHFLNKYLGPGLKMWPEKSQSTKAKIFFLRLAFGPFPLN